MTITNNLYPVIFAVIIMVLVFVGIMVAITTIGKAQKDLEKGLPILRRWKYYYFILAIFILGIIIVFSGGGRDINEDYEEAGIVTMTKGAPAEMTKKEIKKDAIQKKDKLLKKMDTSNFDEEKAEADKYLKKALVNNKGK